MSEVVRESYTKNTGSPVRANEKETAMLSPACPDPRRREEPRNKW